MKRAGITGFTEKSRAEDAARRASEELGPYMTSPRVTANIDETKRISAQVPGMSENMTLGRMTDAPSIKASERHFGSTNDAAHNLAHERQGALESSLAAHKDLMFPPAVEATALSGAQARYAESVEKIDANLRRLESEERVLASKYKRGDQDALGAQAQDVRGKLADSTKAAAKARYDAVYDAANQNGLRVNMADVRDVAANIAKDSGTAFQDKPGVIGDILRRYSPKATPVVYKVTPTGAKIRTSSGKPAPEPEAKFDEFHSLYIRAGSEVSALRQAQRVGSDAEAGIKAAQVEKVRDQLKLKLDEMESPEHGEVGKLLREANEFYRTKYADIFKRGVGAEMGVVGRFGPTSST
jgi:hypothetical protein